MKAAAEGLFVTKNNIDLAQSEVSLAIEWQAQVNMFVPLVQLDASLLP